MLSIFDNDDTLGRDINDPRQLPPVCNCLTGTPRIDDDGNCVCDNSPVTGPLGNYSGPRTMVEHAVQYILPWQPINPATGVKAADKAGDFTIFGFSPWVVAAVAGAGFLIYSSMNDNKRARKINYVD